ncbi:MAG: glycosyltransferase family 39 protein [Ignavibacteria bacterium]|nr:glycosyltransferase family 39 protein [Ignavibacteria bacterium]
MAIAEAILQGVPPAKAWFMSPLYPHLLAALAWAGAAPETWMRLLQCVAGAAAAAAVCAMGRDIATPRAGLAAGLLAACVPALIFADNMLLIESSMTVLAVFHLLALRHGIRKNDLKLLIVAGALLGLLLVFRFSLVAWALLLAVFLLRGGASPGAAHRSRSCSGRRRSSSRRGPSATRRWKGVRPGDEFRRVQLPRGEQRRGERVAPCAGEGRHLDGSQRPPFRRTAARTDAHVFGSLLILEGQGDWLDRGTPRRRVRAAGEEGRPVLSLLGDRPDRIERRVHREGIRHHPRIAPAVVRRSAPPRTRRSGRRVPGAVRCPPARPLFSRVFPLDGRVLRELQVAHPGAARARAVRGHCGGRPVEARAWFGAAKPRTQGRRAVRARAGRAVRRSVARHAPRRVKFRTRVPDAR